MSQKCENAQIPTFPPANRCNLRKVWTAKFLKFISYKATALLLIRSFNTQIWYTDSCFYILAELFSLTVQINSLELPVPSLPQPL